MSLAIDGTPANFVATGGGSSFNIGPITTTFSGGKAFISCLSNGTSSTTISSISGGGLTWTQRTITNQNNSGVDFIEEWSAPVGGSVINNVTFAVTMKGSASYISAGLWAVSNGGSGISFDSGGPQTSTTGKASMTTNETALIMPIYRFSSSGAPTASSPWTGILSGVSNAFQGVEYQVAAASTYTGLFSGSDESCGIIDAVFAAATSTVVFRKTDSSIGGRVGSRQAWGD